MNYFLDAGCWKTVFAVPGAVVDNYIKLASGSAVKVLLYFLRNSGKDISSKEISSALSISEDDVKDAFNFWEEVNIISRSSTDTKPDKIQKTTPSEHTDIKGTPEPAVAAPVIPSSSSSFQITPKEIEKLRQDSGI